MSIFGRIRDWWRRLFGGGTVPPPAPPAPPPPPLEGWAADLFDEHSRERLTAGLLPLRGDSRLTQAAQGHAERMAVLDQLTHHAGGISPAERIAATGYPLSGWGENISAYETPAAVMANWMTSAPHRANVLGALPDVGLGMAVSGRGLRYWCAVYASPR